MAGPEAAAYSEILSGNEELADFCKGNAVLLHYRQLQRAHLREKFNAAGAKKRAERQEIFEI